MNDSRFDDIIRNELSDLNSDSAPKWDLFMKKKLLVDLHQNEKLFDNKVHEKLSDHRATYNSSHWDLLKAHISEGLSLKRKINSYKLVEAILLLLLSFGWLHLKFPNAGNENFKNNTAVAMQLDLNENKANATNLPIGSHDESKTLVINKISPERSGSFKSIIENGPSDFSPSAISGLKKQVHLKTKKKAFVAIQDESETSKLDEIHAMDFATSTENEFINPELTSLQIPSLQPNISTPESRHLSEVPQLRILGSDLVYTTNARKLPGVVNEFGIKPAMQSQTWLHLFVSFDDNIILTPDDLEYNTTERTSEMYGYTVGALFSSQSNKWEFETGLSISNFNKPWSFTQHYGDFNGWYKYSFTNIHHNILAVPLQAKYHFVQNPEWSMFTKFGFSSEFVVLSDYETSNDYIGGGAIPIDGVIEMEDKPIPPFELDHNFSNGFFQGGNIQDNFFLRMNLGLGIQRHISPNIALYFIGEHFHTVVNDQIGPNRDRLNKYALNVGVKYRI